jgi:hypothetical protein
LIALRNFPLGPDKEAFHRYLNDFGAVDCEAALLHALADCNDALPNRYAEQLALPLGSTYRDAAQLLLCSWSTTLRAPGQRSCD